MKKQIILTMLSLAALNVAAQDVVVKKDGSTILAKVLEVNQDNIKYKKYSNRKGPTYTIRISDVMTINYENGEKDTFDVSATTASESQSSQKMIERKAAGNNRQLIAKYNAPITLNPKEQSKKPADKYILIFGVTENSILSNDDIEITYKKNRRNNIFEDDERSYGRISYKINIRNKTNKVIYIDKANCFRVPSNGVALSYLSNEQVTVGKSSGSGASVGLGGIAGALGVGGVIGGIASGVAVGGGSSSSVSSTYNDSRILAIPPMGNVNLRDEKILKISRVKYRLINNEEVLEFPELLKDKMNAPGDACEILVSKDETMNFELSKGLTKQGYGRTFNEFNSPFTINYCITYSTEADFSKFSTANFGIFVREIIGCSLYRKNNLFITTSKIHSDDYILNNGDYIIEGFCKTFK